MFHEGATAAACRQEVLEGVTGKQGLPSPKKTKRDAPHNYLVYT